jgi:hypothetical protein
MDVSSGSAILAFIRNVTAQSLHVTQHTKTICQEQIIAHHAQTYLLKSEPE